MNFLGKTLAVVVGLALLGAMGFGIWLMYQTIVALFASLDPAVATVTGIACLVALAAAWWIARSLQAAVRQGKAMALRDEKTAAYQLFVDYWQARALGQVRTDAAEKLRLLDRLLALYGAQSVIRAHTALRGLDGKGQHAALRTAFGEALVAIRKELGADTPTGAAQELERLLLQMPEPVSGA
jgi:hypothetical protein